MNKPIKIKSSSHALKLSLGLKSVWSEESLLTQRILIYIAELLERKPAKRKKSEWQKHVSRFLKAGKTIKDAARYWRGNQ